MVTVYTRSPYKYPQWVGFSQWVWFPPVGVVFVPSLYREAELLKQLLSVLVDCLVLALATRVVETSLPTLATCEAGWWGEVNLPTA